MVCLRAGLLVLVAVVLWPLGARAVLAQLDDAGGGEGDIPERVNARERGTLAVSSLPGVDVIIDGRHAGTTPWEGTLAVGSHRVRLVGRHPLVDYTATVTVLAGERAVLQHRAAVSVDPPLPPGEARYSAAQRCASVGDHECVIGELRSHCDRARDYELYIAAMRARVGYDLEIEEAMRSYLARYPTERSAAEYRAYLAAHPNRP